MNPRECIEALNEIEADFPVRSWAIGGVRIWPLVRADIWWLNNGDYLSRREAERYGSRFRKVSRLGAMVAGLSREIAAKARDSEKNASWSPHDAVFLGDAVSRIRLPDGWYDRLCEPLIEELAGRGLSSLHLEPNHVYRVPRHRPSLYVQPALDRSSLQAQFRRVQMTAPGYEDALAQLSRRGFDVGPARPAPLARRMAMLLQRVDWFGKRFDQVAPQVGFVVDNNLATMAFHVAARRRGVPTMEIQHGVINPDHWAYALWADQPDEGFETMPRFVWVWSTSDGSSIAPTKGQCTPMAGGNLWLERWLAGGFPLAQRYDEEIKEVARGRERSVLVTLQTGFSNKDQLSRLRLLAEQRPNWAWWIRLHPVMRMEEVEAVHDILEGLIPRRVTQWVSEVPLYALLRHVDVHLTFNSSVTVEAARFGVPTILSDENATNLYPEQIRSGSAKVETGDPLLLIEQAERVPPQASDSDAAKVLEVVLKRA